MFEAFTIGALRVSQAHRAFRVFKSVYNFVLYKFNLFLMQFDVLMNVPFLVLYFHLMRF